MFEPVSEFALNDTCKKNRQFWKKYKKKKKKMIFDGAE